MILLSRSYRGTKRELDPAVHRQLTLAACLCVAPALTRAQPVASTTEPISGRERAAPDAQPVPVEPDPAALAAAPTADRASGVVVPAPRARHRVANTLLAIPRYTATMLLTGPRYAAAGVDSYLESRSPNAFGRDVRSSWRFGALGTWEPRLGGSLAARVGHTIGDDGAIDLHAGGLGPRGISGGLRGEYGVASLALDAGKGMDRTDRLFAATDYEQDAASATAGVKLRSGALRGGASLTADIRRNDLATTPPIPLAGIDETHRAATGELSIGIDTRRPVYRTINVAAPAAGTLVRLTGGYLRGQGTVTPPFQTARLRLELQQLIDLFHGDRVLTLNGRAEAVSARAEALPFDRLPALGGAHGLRALGRDELRGRTVGVVEAQYEWPLGEDSRAYLLVEGGHVLDFGAIAGYGGGIRFLKGSSTVLRLQLAGATDGSIGFSFQLGAL
jgi:hypothetical protein